MTICCPGDSSSYMVHQDLFRTIWFEDDDSPYRLTVRDINHKQLQTSAPVEKSLLQPKQTLIHVALYMPPSVSSFPVPFFAKLWSPEQIDHQDIKSCSKAAQIMNNYFLEDDEHLFKEVASETDDLDLANEYLSNFEMNCLMSNRAYVRRLEGTVLKGANTAALTTGSDYDTAERLLHRVNAKRKVGEKIYLISRSLLTEQLGYAKRNLHTLTELSKDEDSKTAES